MNERGKFDKVIAKDEESEELLKDHFEDGTIAEFLEYSGETQRTPTQEEAALVTTIQNVVEDALRKLGITPRRLSLSRIVFCDPKIIEDEGAVITEGGSTYNVESLVIIRNEKNDFLKLAHYLTHELIHIQSFSSLHGFSDPNNPDHIQAGPRKLGLKMHINKAESQYDAFQLLNEAVTEMLSQKIAREYFPQIDVLKGFIIEDTGFYQEERAELQKLCDSLQRLLPSKFPNTESLLAMLTTSMFTGKSLEFARIIDDVYGKGSFRELGIRFSSSPIHIDDILNRAHTA